MASSSSKPYEGPDRIHIGLPVRDAAASADFYQKLLHVRPTKTRPGYARFESEQPRVNLSIIEHSDARPMKLPGHFGIQVDSSNQLDAMIHRLEQAGLQPRLETNTSCCFAVQDKAWIHDPDGNEWEVFVVKQDHTEGRSESACCTPDCCGSEV